MGVDDPPKIFNICSGGKYPMGSPVRDFTVGTVPNVPKGVALMGKWSEYACDM